MAQQPDFRLTAVDATRQAFDSVRRNIDQVNSSALSLRGTLVGLGGAISVGALVGSLRSVIDTADELRQLNKSIDEGSDGFKRLGLDPKQFTSTEQALKAVADRFAATADGAGKTAVAMDLFGRSGAQLIPLLNQGSAGLREMGDEARRFGIVISSDAAKAAEVFNDNLTRLGAAARGVGVSLANELLPTLTAYTEEMLDGVRITGSFREALATLGTINPFRNQQENIRALNEELARLKDGLKVDPLADGLVDNSDAVRTAQQQLEFLRRQAQREALATTGGAKDLDSRDIRANRPTQLATIAPPPDKEAERAAKRAAEERARAEEQAQRKIHAESTRQWEEERRFIEEATRLDEQRRDKELKALEKIADERRRQDVEESRRLLEDQDDALQSSVEEAVRRTREITDESHRAQDAARELGLTFASAFEDAAIAGEKPRKVIQGLIQDIARIGLRKLITEPIANALSVAFGSILSGTRASGGPVFGGGAYLVGERGPELFVPGSSGNIIPNGALATAGGGGTVINIDARGADLGVVPRIEQGVARAVAASRAVARDDQRRRR
jgi:hypothetical protein